jgi:hypothetical protein
MHAHYRKAGECKSKIDLFERSKDFGYLLKNNVLVFLCNLLSAGQVFYITKNIDEHLLFMRNLRIGNS